MSTFTKFKDDFYARVPDLRLFDCGEINLTKVVLDGLKVNYAGKGALRPFLFYPLPLYHAFVAAKRLRQKSGDSFQRLQHLKGRPYLVSEVGRLTPGPDGKQQSLYFPAIVAQLQRKQVTIVADKVADASPDHDATVAQLNDWFLYQPLTPKEKAWRQQLLAAFDRINASGIFNAAELENIRFAIHRFFYQYKVWSRFLDLFPTLTTCYFTCHYHKEGQILALKERGIRCVELQHGLIAAQDIFYVFPPALKPVKDKALFADEILVYGPYWKDVLLQGAEYDEDQIHIAGYYLYEHASVFQKEEEALKALTSGKRVYLLTTQTFLHDAFIRFANDLASEITARGENALVLLKPHPAEKKEMYEAAFQQHEVIRVTTLPLPILFRAASLHISIYSTTLYEALRFGLSNYVFDAQGCEDYVDGIVASGVATRVASAAGLFQQVSKNTQADPAVFFSAFDPAFIH